MSEPIYIALCGESEYIGAPVIEGLKPEIEVVNFTQASAQNAADELPYVLCGKAPLSNSSRLGTGNYGKIPQAVVLGGAAEFAADEKFKLISSALEKEAEARLVPILRSDKKVEMPPRGPEYGKRVIERVKAALFKLKEDGKLDGKHGGEEFY
ncbi:hypothetical protein BT63DRAFT_426552 [Microthyrium microscopicum]|uniref:Uncharacterized protein n=1 Tax=Microthyrium microscopicum TaxID=703497 RepID=A0A6A6U7Y0_9PEZI|nr:hypothetical protein BT63DRAFT_426552 [Microthyrium microscopicum]